MAKDNTSDRALAAKLAGLTSWANTVNRTERTAKPRAALEQRFYKQVDPDGTLAPEVREQMAQAARRAFYARLTLASVKARRGRAAARSRRSAPAAAAGTPDPTSGAGGNPDANAAAS